MSCYIKVHTYTEYNIPKHHQGRGCVEKRQNKLSMFIFCEYLVPQGHAMDVTTVLL
jgi:hypothetical protein